MSGVLTLDLGITLGWATNTPGSTTSGVEDFSKQWGESAGMCMLRFKSWLDRITMMAQVTEIHYELVQGYRSGAAARVWAGFWSHLLSWCEEAAIPCSGVPVATLKKWATGKGNANKQAMIDAAVAKGWLPEGSESHDEADALHLLDYVLNVKN